jgi:phosphoribosylanthranilate isomerase
MLIKICGITRLEDAGLAADLGAAAVGFIFWPASPRFIDPHRARPIVRALPPFVAPIGVFVNQPLEYVRAVASLVRLAAVQMHGDEPDAYIQQIDHRVIRAIGLAGPDAESRAMALPPRVTVLLDAHDPDTRGGTGRTIDWSAASRVARGRRTILSGGLHADNVAEAIAVVRPYAIDVSSGVEKSPGVKDPDRLRAFFERVRASADEVRTR